MTPRSCPICEKAPPAPSYHPFCSRRCADLDLQRWLSGAYVMPGMEAEDEGPGGHDPREA